MARVFFWLAAVLAGLAHTERYCSKKYEDCSHTDCCADADKGYTCYRKNAYYSGCKKKCPKGWDCARISKANPDCAAASENCDHLGCCQDPGYKCFKHNMHWAQCKKSCPEHWDCTEITPDTATPAAKATEQQAEEEGEGQDDGIPKLRATHFWDCNGGSCDAPILQPWDEHKYVYAPQYAPADPADYGGSMYGEKLWMTGAASDLLSDKMGPDREGCGYSTEGGGGCGQCIIVRNPRALNPNWTAVVMKRNRCPPASPGCHKAHMDIAVPGFDALHVSLSNVCGKRGMETYITKEQSATCAGQPPHSCDCSAIPDDSPERRMLRKGCELFKAWGWHRGDPLLNYQPVQCPPAFIERVRTGRAFSSLGVVGFAAAGEPALPPRRRGLALPAVACGAIAGLVGAGALAVRLSRRGAKPEPQALLEVGPPE